MGDEIRDLKWQIQEKRKQHLESVLSRLTEIFEAHRSQLTDGAAQALTGVIIAATDADFWSQHGGFDKAGVLGRVAEANTFLSTFGWILADENSLLRTDRVKLSLAFFVEEMTTTGTIADSPAIFNKFEVWSQSPAALRILKPQASSTKKAYSHSILKGADLQICYDSGSYGYTLEFIVSITNLDPRLCDAFIEHKSFRSGGQRRKSVKLEWGTFGDSHFSTGSRTGYSNSYEAFSAAKGSDIRITRLGIPIESFQMRFDSRRFDYT